MERRIKHIFKGQPASDGAGVKLTRLFGGSSLEALDPFLMLDEFNSDKADDYIAGFPSHPHRGFETVTYMLEGNMLHQDHLGNEGLLRSGDVQWMTAARGIIHSEMPQQVDGLMRGFQLWINLPASEKMKSPNYKDISAKNIPIAENEQVQIKVIAGEINWNNQLVKGAVHGISTEPLYLDVRLKAEQTFSLPTPSDHAVLVYVFDGQVEIDNIAVQSQHMVQMQLGDLLKVKAKNNAAFLVLAGKPLKEPIAHWGPFVMNTREEIEQAINDYRSGQLTT